MSATTKIAKILRTFTKAAERLDAVVVEAEQAASDAAVKAVDLRLEADANTAAAERARDVAGKIRDLVA